jgi:hypothetical protein
MFDVAIEQGLVEKINDFDDVRPMIIRANLIVLCD